MCLRRFFIVAMILIFVIPIQSQNILNQHLEVISPSNFEKIKQIGMFHRGTIEEMSWSPDGKLVAVGGSAGGWIYDATNLKAEPTHFAQFMRVNDVDFHPDGTKIISTGYDGSVFEWDSTTGELIREISPEEFHQCQYCVPDVMSVKYSLDGNYINIGTVQEGSLFLDSVSAKVLTIIPYSTENIAFSPDSQYVAASDINFEDTLYIWSVESLINGQHEPEQIYSEFQFAIRDLAWTEKSQSIIVAGEGVINVVEYDLTNQNTAIIGKGDEIVAIINDIVVSRTVEYEDSGYYSLLSQIQITSLDKTSPTGQFNVTGRISDLQFSPNGQLAIGTEKGSIELWDINQLKRIDSVVGTGEMITAVDLIDDTYLITLETEAYSVYRDGGVCGDNILRMWDLSENKEVKSWRASVSEIGHFSCSAMIALPDSQQLILQNVLKENAEIIVVNPFTDQYFSLKMPFENPRPYHRFEFKISNDQLLLGILAIGGTPQSDELFIWNISQGLHAQNQVVGTFTSFNNRVDDFVFTADNKNIVVASHDGSMTVWDIESENQIGSIDWNTPDWFSTVQLALSPDGSTLAINAGEIQLYDTMYYELIRAWDDKEYGTGEHITFGASDDWFATHRHYTTYRFWTTKSDSIFELPTQTNSITFSHDNTFFVTGGEDGAIRIWGIPIRN